MIPDAHILPTGNQKATMSNIIYDPIEWKAGELFCNGKISKLEEGKKIGNILERVGWIHEQYPNTPSEKFATEKNGNYINMTIYPEQDACRRLEQLMDGYDTALSNQIEVVIGPNAEFYRVKKTLNFPPPKAGVVVKKDPTKPELPKLKKGIVNIETKNVVYYQDKPLDKINMSIYYETRKPVYTTITNPEKRDIAYAKLTYKFKLPDEVTKAITEVEVHASELDEKKEFSELVVKHRSVNSIEDGTKKPHECKTPQELEQIYGKSEDKIVKNFIELGKLMGFNGYRRYVFYPKATQADASLKNDEKSKLKVKWYVGCIDIIQVKGNSFENRKTKYDDMLSDYGSSEAPAVTESNFPALQAPTTKAPVVKKPVVVAPQQVVVDDEEDDEEDDEDGEEVVVVPPPAPAPAKGKAKATPAPAPAPVAPKKPVTNTKKPVPQPVVVAQEEEEDDDEDGEDGEDGEDDDE